MTPRDQVAIVTGAGSGLGRETARLLAEAGARIVCVDRDRAACAEAAEQVGGIAAPCDIADTSGLEAALADARQAVGPARILVGCAGIDTPGRIVGKDGAASPLDDFAAVIRTNLIGTYNVLRLVAADMKNQRPLETGERGVIINTASIVAFEGQVGHTAYAASKAGIIGMTLPAARELSRSGIRVVTIAPGLFETPMIHRVPEEIRKTLGDNVPFPSRLGRPDEFARLALHIIENVMLNGEVVRLDGALRLPPV